MFSEVTTFCALSTSMILMPMMLKRFTLPMMEPHLKRFAILTELTMALLILPLNMKKGLLLDILPGVLSDIYRIRSFSRSGADDIAVKEFYRTRTQSC